MRARWLPKGFHTITPNIIVDDADQSVFRGFRDVVIVEIHWNIVSPMD